LNSNSGLSNKFHNKGVDLVENFGSIIEGQSNTAISCHQDNSISETDPNSNQKNSNSILIGVVIIDPHLDTLLPEWIAVNANIEEIMAMSGVSTSMPIPL
jgi:hypothetical protein